MTAEQDRIFALELEAVAKSLPRYLARIAGTTCEAEDLAQDTLLLGWKFRNQFEGRSNLRTWLVRIAVNRVRTIHRYNRSRPVSQVAIGHREEFDFNPMVDLFEQPDSSPLPDSCIDRIDLVRALPSLSPKLKEGLSWYLNHDKSSKVSTSKVRAYRAIAKLRIVLASRKRRIAP